MPRGDKSKYTDEQERKAEHIAESYEERGVPEKEAERRAWATVNKDDGGGKKPGGLGRGAHAGHPAAHRGENWADAPQPRAALRIARPRPGRRQRRASETPNRLAMIEPQLDPNERLWLRRSARRGVAVCAGE